MLLNQRKITALKLLFVVYLSIPVFLWWSETRISVYSIGHLFGFISLSLVALQPLLSSRLKLLEHGVGHDRLMRWHGTNAKYAMIFVLFHPMLMFSNYIQRGVSPLEISSFYNIQGFLLGYLMLSVLVFIVVTSLFTNRLNLSYETWRKIHLLVYIVIFGGFLHSYLIGSYVQHGTFNLWWLTLLVIAATGVLHRYVWLPHKRQMYTVESVKSNSSVAHTITLSPKDGSRLAFYPGQFAYTHFFSKAVPAEEHHFTLSSAPSEEMLQFTIKNLGDFTSHIHQVKKGETVQVEGPYGAFNNTAMTGPFLFIAGGIGITPIRSMLAEMKMQGNTQKSVVLYSANAKEEFAFYEELTRWGKEDWLTVHFYESRLTQKEIGQALTALGTDAKVFLCGPLPMMKAVEQILKELGMPIKRVFTEKFALK